MAVTILDQTGEVVATLSGTGAAGLNRIHWDLRYAPTNEVRLRTNPLFAHHVPLGPDGWRLSPGGAPRLSVLAPPGTYTVKLSVGGRELKETLTVRKDPNSGGTVADIEAQTKVLVVLRKDMNTAVDAVNQIEIVRSQLDSLGRVVGDAGIKQAGGELAQKLIDLEMNLIELRLTGGQDGVRYAAKLLSRINYLANGMASNDFKPTDQQLEVQKLLQQRLRNHVGQLDSLLSLDLGGFNELLKKRNIANIIAPTR